MNKFSLGRFITIEPPSLAYSESNYRIKFIRTGYGRSSLVIKIANKTDHEKYNQTERKNTVEKSLSKFKEILKKKNHFITLEDSLNKEKIKNLSITERNSFSTARGSTVTESSFD